MSALSLNLPPIYRILCENVRKEYLFCCSVFFSLSLFSFGIQFNYSARLITSHSDSSRIDDERCKKPLPSSALIILSFGNVWQCLLLLLLLLLFMGVQDKFVRDSLSEREKCVYSCVCWQRQRRQRRQQQSSVSTFWTISTFF